jgi:RimJ/RimL family protein N-acetyltransferase
MADNQRAIALYRRMGYEREGLRRDSLLVDGRFVDEYAMARILHPLALRRNP